MKLIISVDSCERGGNGSMMIEAVVSDNSQQDICAFCDS